MARKETRQSHQQFIKPDYSSLNNVESLFAALQQNPNATADDLYGIALPQDPSATASPEQQATGWKTLLLTEPGVTGIQKDVSHRGIKDPKTGHWTVEGTTPTGEIEKLLLLITTTGNGLEVRQKLRNLFRLQTIREVPQMLTARAWILLERDADDERFLNEFRTQRGQIRAFKREQKRASDQTRTERVAVTTERLLQVNGIESVVRDTEPGFYKDFDEKAVYDFLKATLSDKQVPEIGVVVTQTRQEKNRYRDELQKALQEAGIDVGARTWMSQNRLFIVGSDMPLSDTSISFNKHLKNMKYWARRDARTE